MNRRNFYLFLLCLLAVILYLDRICISVAGPRMQEALRLGPEQWGWVGAVFLIGYALFEIPGGHWGDRVGARRVLTRIVVWWSVFTSLTGLVAGLPVLLLVRFCFGAGEAGAFPNASVAISRWFSPAMRGRAFGLFTMCSQIGGALSPLLVIPLQQAYGWRASFFVFGTLGVVWAVVWFWQFRDYPPGVAPDVAHRRESWLPLLESTDLRIIMGIAFGYVYTMSFFQTWLHTFLVKGRDFNEDALSLSSLPYVFAAAANILGGVVGDWLVGRVGVVWSRRAVGAAGLLLSATCIGLTIAVTGHLSTILCLSMAYAGICFQQPIVFAACLDIGGRRGGAVAGFMNTAGQVAGAISSAVFGYLVRWTGSYNAPMIPMTLLLLLGVLLWLKVDVTRRIPQTERARAAN